MGPGGVEFVTGHGDVAEPPAQPDAVARPGRRRTGWCIAVVVVLAATGVWWANRPGPQHRAATTAYPASSAPASPAGTAAGLAGDLMPMPVAGAAHPGTAHLHQQELMHCVIAVSQRLSAMAQAYRAARRHGKSAAAGDRAAVAALGAKLKDATALYRIALREWRQNRHALLSAAGGPVVMNGCT